MYVQGENPAMSDPNLNHARGALSMLEHLVVQDIFLTETAGFADVIFPASAFSGKERHLHKFQPPSSTGTTSHRSSRERTSRLVDHTGSGATTWC